MSRGALEPKVPFVRPDPRVLKDLAVYSSAVPFAPVLESVDRLFGVVPGLDADGVVWLTDLLRRKDGLQARILLALQPACSTREADLRQLMPWGHRYPRRQ